MSSVQTGARVKFKIDNKTVAYANAVTYTVSHQHQPVDVLGKPEPEEYAEVGYTVNFTCTMFRINSKGAVELGLRPRLQDFLAQGEALAAEMYDRTDDSLLFQITRIKCTQEDFNVDARNLAQLTLSFVGVVHSESAKESVKSQATIVG